MSGDNNRTANAIARKLGINLVISQISPENKANEIANYRIEVRK